MKLSTKLKLGVASVAAGALITSAVYAGGSNPTVGNITVNFVDPFTVSENTPVLFAGIMPGVAETYDMAAATGAITAGGAGGGVSATGSTAGDYTITDSGGTANVDITVDSAAGGTIVSVTDFDCTYGGNAGTSAAGKCTFSNFANPTSAGTHLLVGPNISVTNAGVDGNNEALTFAVTVAYN